MWFSAALLACHRIDVELDVDLLPPSAVPVEVPEASPFELALFDERPEADLPAFLDLETFGPALLADRVRLGESDGFVTVAVEDVVFSVDAPLTLRFDVASTDGRWHVLGDETGGEAPSCTLVVDADTAAAAQAEGLLACLRETAAAVGGPADFAIHVTGTTTDDDWEYRATYVLGTERPVDVACSGALVLSDELLEQAGTTEIVVEELSLAGYAAARDAAASVVMFAATWSDEAAPPAAGAWGTTRVEAGHGRFVGEEVEVDPPLAGISFGGGAEAVTAWPGDWAAQAMDTLLAEGFVETCDVRVHDVRPNQTWVEAALVGTAEAIR